ncbi:MAG TPA: hypothetical protein PKV13_02095 [Propionicimonas sp.]|nr:hypothetical protein [Propionicimonas sp.]
MRQRPPLRALALAAALMVVGLVLVLMAHLLAWHLVLALVGSLALLLGVALFVASLAMARSMSVDVVLDDVGYRVSGPGTEETGRWADISRVTRADGTLTLRRLDGTALHLVVSRSSVADLDALGADIARRLDADRGYH